MLRDNLTTYGFITKILHWVIAIVILVQMFLGIFNDYLPESLAGLMMMWHKSLGLLLLALALVFIVWRLINPKPAYPNSMQTWEKLAAYIIRISLYFLLLAMPLTGWIMSTAAGYVPSFFGWFTVAAPFISKNAGLTGTCANLHELFAWYIGILIAIHIAAALKHQFFNKDNILQRMM